MIKVEQIYVPQALSEENIFTFFEHRGMKVLIINPRTESNLSYIASSVGVGS